MGGASPFSRDHGGCAPRGVRPPGPYEALSDEQVLRLAAIALMRVNEGRLGSIQRSVQWGVYDAAKAELDRRLYRHVIGRLRPS